MPLASPFTCMIMLSLEFSHIPAICCGMMEITFQAGRCSESGLISEAYKLY